MYDLSQSTKRCSIQIMKQLSAACFDFDAVSLHSDSVAHNVHSHQEAAPCLSILLACLACSAYTLITLIVVCSAGFHAA